MLLFLLWWAWWSSFRLSPCAMLFRCLCLFYSAPSRGAVLLAATAEVASILHCRMWKRWAWQTFRPRIKTESVAVALTHAHAPDALRTNLVCLELATTLPTGHRYYIRLQTPPPHLDSLTQLLFQIWPHFVSLYRIKKSYDRVEYSVCLAPSPGKDTELLY